MEILLLSHAFFLAFLALSPVQVAEKLYRQFPSFYVNPAAGNALLSPALNELLRRESACLSKGVCAFETNPWTSAQDGDMVEPIRFTTLTQTSSHARVRMCYVFLIRPDESENRCAEIVLDRNASGEWQVSDLISPHTGSIVKTLQTYDYTLE